MNAPIANTVPLRAVPAPSQKYLDYLRRDRARRRNIRIAQALLLVVFLCAWEILPRMHILNPLPVSYTHLVDAADGFDVAVVDLESADFQHCAHCAASALSMSSSSSRPR